ncbi:MAG: UDP-N-acetylmuramoyl-L-alanyl-D-glutamate--2,6-diaminopimelate ligase [Kiritimatiellae bacterium]|nr:UDP-N-acetylmuramoyl-L-alanyl-D-glutamate--2,6-diaminopimelate ligase [Kiritimatiellia bacterium]MDD5522205.1 UDP-N-acetylmuramoyl-L-alanyl-D-glutamate--2,6-diaminopimelate ligase [Kiritimatiellia bacterium]
MKLDTLLKDVDCLSVNGRRDRDISGIVCDSRQVRPGYIFVAIPGVEKDGWIFIKDAIERGAVAIVSEHDELIGRDVCHVCVRDARKVIADLSCIFHNRPSDHLQVIGITGTNGKTTTAYMINNVLHVAGHIPGLLTTVEYRIGERTIPASRTTPDAPLLQSMLAQIAGAGCKSVVMEVSSHALIQKRSEGIDYDIAVFTNLTRDHLDYHRTMEQYFEAKMLLFAGLGRGRKHAKAVINIDDTWGQKISVMDDIRAEIVTFGMKAEAMVRAENIELTGSGSSFHVVTPWGTKTVQLKLLGRFNISNALAAIASCGSLGINLDVITDAICRVTSVPGRLEEISTRKGFQVFVDYAHTDDALENVLKTLREIVKGRLIVVFGCGGNRDKTKRPVMGNVAAKLADYSVLTSDNPRKENASEIIAQIQVGFGESKNFEVIEDRTEAIKRALTLAVKGDIVLIAGKGHENFQEFANTLISFDDRQIVKRYL